jgi:alpha-L-fucosidase
MMSRLLLMAHIAILLGSSASVLGQRGDPLSNKHSPADVEGERAALQEDFLKLRFGLFLHFNMATYVNREWANGYEDPTIFKPDRLNCNQWADVACAAGMKYGVLTVKHTGGWCLWDSKHTTHDISSFINYKSGKGDIVREFVDAFRARGLKVGFYYCFPGDFSNTRHGNAVPEGKPDLHGLPPEAAGDYVGFIKLQLTELLTKYGPIDLLWIDQYSNKYTRLRWQEILAHIKSLQPKCLVIGNNAHNLKDSDVYSCEFPWDPKSLPPEGNRIPAEVCDKISRTWFWNTGDKAEHVRDAREIIKMLKLCNERNANYLLNVPPDRNGLISGIHLERMEEIVTFASAQENSKPDRKAGNNVLPVKGYELSWSDEFEGKVLDFEKWDYRGLGPRRDAFNVKDAVLLDGEGYLVLTTKRVKDKYHTAMIGTQGKFETAFGYFECRVKLQTQIGHWSAFWLQSPTLGESIGDPGKAGAEIDIFEYLRNRGDKIQHTLHWDGYGKSHKSAQKIAEIPGLSHGWHTVGFLWMPTHYVFYMDGRETWRTNKGVSHRPQYIILSLEVGKWAGDISKAELPDHFYVDYVRVYKEVAAKPK